MLSEKPFSESTDDIIPNEIKGIPLFDIHMKRVEVSLTSEDALVMHSDEPGGFGVVRIDGQEKDDENVEVEKFISVGDLEATVHEGLWMIFDICEDRFKTPAYKVWISDSIAVYGVDKDVRDLSLEIGQAINELNGSNYFYGFDWNLDTPALFRVKYDDEEANVFSLNDGGWLEKTYDNKQFDILVELTNAGLNESKLVDLESEKHKPEKFYPDHCVFDKSGLACVRGRNGKYGFIDKGGTLVIDCIYDYAIGFYNALESFDAGLSLIDHHGCYLSESDCECAYKGIATVKRDGKAGFIDTKGNCITDCIYDEAYRFYEGVASVMKDGKSFKIDTKGNVI